MNDSVNTEPAVTDAQIAASRKKMLLIFGCFGIPLVLATLWLQVVRSQGGTWGNTSRGELIHPAVPMSDFSIDQFVMKNEGAQVDDAFREVAEPFTAEDFRKTWSMFYLPEGACEDSCRKNLYHMRQIRLALNNRMNRVQRVVLIESPTQLDGGERSAATDTQRRGGDGAQC